LKIADDRWILNMGTRSSRLDILLNNSAAVRARGLFFVVLAGLSVALFAGGPRLFAVLAYQRSAILRGSVWQLVTAHFIHANATHLLWNLAGTLVVGLAVANALSIRRWLIAAAIVALGSSGGVLLLQPEVRVMAGLSGLLHGLLAAGAVAQVRRGQRIGWLLLALVTLKVAWEQLVGPTAITQALLGNEIAAGAHACGALTGVLAGLVVHRDAGAIPSPTSRPPRRGSDRAPEE
jgi:rhomboid family GlyGly-CTERM serine protease